MVSETIANGDTEIVHRLDLDDYGLRDVPQGLKLEAKQGVADYLENQILREVNAGVSPVQGEGRFARLNTEYAVREKGGTRLSNLEKEGDLLTDFRVNQGSGSFLDVGHRGDQVPKSDGHNQLSGKARAWARQNNFPRRRYIPDSNQRFVSKITDEIKDIISESVPAPVAEEQQDITPTISSTVEEPGQVVVTTDTLFSDDVIDSLLEDAIRRRRGQI